MSTVPTRRAARGELSTRIRGGLSRASWLLIASAVAVLFLYPLWVMVGQVIKSPTESNQIPPTFFPHSFYLGNFANLDHPGSGINLITSIANTAVVAVSTTVITAIVTTLAGYAFARLPFPGGRIAFFTILSTFMIPFQAVITPLFLLLRDIGLLGSLPGLILVLVTFNLPLGTFLMRNSFAAIPAAIEEAALIDGCSTLQALWRVMLPAAVPGLVSTALLTFFASWNEFFATIILISDQSRYTLPVSLGILSSAENGSVNWALIQTGALVTVAPCIVVYLVLQRYYVSGLLGGALK